MPIDFELKVAQKDKLYSFYILKKLNDKAGITVIGLAHEISRAEAVMEQGDVALVKEKIKELV